MNQHIVEDIWQQYKEWSAAANRLKSSISRWRSSVLVLAVSGAFLETLSTQVPDGAREIIVWAGAILLAIIPIVTPRKLSPKQTENWTRARSVSEGLKVELYTYLAKAGVYVESADKDIETLRDRCLEITKSAEDLVKYLQSVSQAKLPEFNSPGDYLKYRVTNQIDWYKKKAKIHKDKSSKLRTIEFSLAIAAVLLSVSSGVISKWLQFEGWSIEIGVWVAVITTIGGTLTAHIAASRYDHIVTSYSATAHQLRNLKLHWPPVGGGEVPSADWSEFVRQCEDAISKENESWMAKWVKED